MKYYISTATGDELRKILQTAKEIICELGNCNRNLKEQKERKKKIFSFFNILGLLITFLACTGIIFLTFIVATYYVLDFFGVLTESDTAPYYLVVLYFLASVMIVFAVFRRWVINDMIKIPKKIRKYQTQLQNILMKVEEEKNKKALSAIPNEYRFDEYALTKMLQYLERGSADSWKEVTHLYEEHLHRKRMEENAQKIFNEIKK